MWGARYNLALAEVGLWYVLQTRASMVVDSLRYCQNNKGLIIHAWCLMPSHLHMIVSSNSNDLSSIMADMKKHTSNN